jgi:hypothetical protein
MNKLSLYAILLLLAATVYGNSPGTIGYQFLRTHTGARPSAMAGSFLAVPGDIHNIYYNPAGINRIPISSATFTYLDHLLDVKSGFAGYVHPNILNGTIGVGALYVDYGNFEGADEQGNPTGDFGASSVALSLTYATYLMNNLSLGTTAKFIHASIESHSSNAVALDASIMYAVPLHDLHIAVGVFNLGETLTPFVDRKEELPVNFKAGVSKKLAHLPLLVSLTLYKYNEEQWHGALGGEFILTDYLFFRLGYDHIGRDMQTGSSRDRFAGAAMGFGVLFKSLRFDYALTSFGDLGTLNRFTLAGHF